MSFYPNFDEIIQGTEREQLLLVKRSLRSVIPNIFYFFCATAIVAMLEYYLYDVPMPDLPVIRHLSVRWLALIPVVFLLEIVRRYHDDLYIFGEHRLTHLEGRLSLSYSVPMISYVDVRAITVKQDIFGRLLDYGTIEIGTAAVEGNEVTIQGIRAPVELAALIDEFRTFSKGKRREEAKSEGNEAVNLGTSSSE
jgi:membrane protein YdbS with pleckstrin-like domain